MSRSRILDVVSLIKEGWRPYQAKPDVRVYERLGCRLEKRQPLWFVRGDIYCCVGCSAHCCLQRPAGFPLPLPIRYRHLPHEEPFLLTPQELMARRNLLTVKQAAYCLNVSERQVYNYIAEGKLIRLKETPVRVRVDEVRALCTDFDE